jgi:hypothetical protein
LAARQAAVQAARQAHHDGPLAVRSLAPALAAALTPPPATPLAPALQALLTAVLLPHGHSKPTCTRLAVLVAGLLGGTRGTPTAIATAAFAQGLGTAQQEASVARRVARLLDAPQLAPTRVLPALTQALLPVLLADLAQAHDHSIGSGGRPNPHHARWRGVRLVLDETTHTDQTHILVLGLVYRGGVVPLAVRTWPQNQPQPPGAYWAAVVSLLQEVHQALPPALRAHVVLLGDRFYGVTPVLALLAVFGWACVLRVQGQTCVRLPDGTERPLRALVPHPGTVWTSAPHTRLPPADPPPGVAAPADDWAPVFKGAGWLPLRVVAVWREDQAAPWLLVTSLPATRARLRDYARRWAIERLFLAWKSHGWDLEAAQPTPRRLPGLLTGYVLATWWLLAAAVPRATAYLAQLAAPRTRPRRHPVQLPLPWNPPPRPWPAKRSLLTIGRQAFQALDLRVTLPPLCWQFPDWDAPTWSRQCTQLYHGLTPDP